LMYWLARALMMAHRRMIYDDPVFFARRDSYWPSHCRHHGRRRMTDDSR
jgi:hypothetical protein